MEILKNDVVTLLPFDEKYVDQIYEAAKYEEIWTHMSVKLDSIEAVKQYVKNAIAQREAKTAFPFVVIHNESNKVVGATFYMDISEKDKRLEIGSTWYTPAYWRTAVNTNCKFLLLQYAFENLQYQRVQIKTGHLNVKSQAAIERIGAVKEGILRNHMITKEGNIRHTVMYSIVENEWQYVKNRLVNKL